MKLFKLAQITILALIMGTAINAVARNVDFSDSEAKKRVLEQRLNKIKTEHMGNFNMCKTERDCPQPKCPDCRMLCIEGKCVFVQCKDHGTFDLSKGGCVCDPGYTGAYCERTLDGSLAPVSQRHHRTPKFKKEK